MPARVAVIGPGALGRALGDVLARGGAEVLYRGRDGWIGGASDTGRPKAQEGGAGEDGHLLPRETELDLALVTVKAYDTAEAVAAALSDLGRATVVSLQNGIGNVEAIAAAGVPQERILGGTTTHAARRDAAGRHEHVAHGETCIAPLVPAGLPAARAAAELLSRHGIPTAVHEDLPRLLWRKLAISCGVNGVTALRRIPNGAVLEDPAALAEAVAATAEALEVAAALGVGPLGDNAESLVRGVCERTAANRSSMLQDVEAGRMTETSAIHGGVCRAARGLGRTAPVNEKIYARLAAAHDMHLVRKMTAHA